MTKLGTMLANLFQVVVLVGSVNWLVTGFRLTMDNTVGTLANSTTLNVNTTLVVPDALSWGNSMFQQVVYYLVGISGLGLVLLSFGGYWIREGEAMIACSAA